MWAGIAIRLVWLVSHSAGGHCIQACVAFCWRALHSGLCSIMLAALHSGLSSIKLGALHLGLCSIMAGVAFRLVLLAGIAFRLV